MELEGEKSRDGSIATGRERERALARWLGAKRSAAAALQGYLGTGFALGCVCDPRSDITSSRGWEMGKGDKSDKRGDRLTSSTSQGDLGVRQVR